MTPRAQKKALESAMLSNSRCNCRNGTDARNESGSVKRSLRDASSLGPGGLSLAAPRPKPPVCHSRMLRARPRPLWAILPDLPEKAKTFSGFLGALIHTVVCTFGAFAARRSVSLSNTI